MLFRRPRPQLFPYTTLFRSDRARTLALHVDGAAVRPEVWRQAGTQLTDTAAAVVAGGLTAAGTPADEDPAAAELTEHVAQLDTGTAPQAGAQHGRQSDGCVRGPPTTN